MFNKLTNELNTIENLADTPNRTSGLSAEQMKKAFDENAQIIKQYINDTLIAELEGNGALSGYSGAKNIGVANREEFSDKTNIEDVLVYFRGLIRQAVAGEIGDNDIKSNMLDHTSGNEAVITNTIHDGAVTNAKLAGGITSDKIASVFATAISGAITNAQLAGDITYDKLAGGIRASQLYGEIPNDKLAGSISADKLAGEIPFSKTTGVLDVAQGGTGASDVGNARDSLQVSLNGQLKIGDTTYTLRTGAYGSGADGYITFSTT